MARPVRLLWLASVVLPGLVLLGIACSDDPAATTDGPDASPDTKPAPTSPFPVDDAAKPPVKRPPPVIPTCVGDSVALQASGERGYVSVNMAADGGDGGPMRGDFLLDFGANGSTIDLGAFAPPGPPTPASCFGDAAAPGATCSFNDFDFFGPWGTVTLVTGDYRFLINSVKQAGIIGTDFLSVYPFTLDYAHAKVWRAKPGTFCTDAQLLGSGFAPIPVGGFYTNVFKSLRPLSDVIDDPDAAATAGYVVPNVPTVPITIAGASALAQLDTGYDDRITRHSINVNQALLDQLHKKTPVQITRRMSKDIYLTTCVPGLSQLATAWALTDGTEVNFVGEGGTIARHDTGTILFVKERLPAAERCGGIETWTVPAAQMGASFLVDAQAVVFDPVTSRVWLPKD
ncbi:hypothetical protein BH11MYX4_BH11MYX4_48610 [soil metagenome]